MLSMLQGKTLAQLMIKICEITYVYIARLYNNFYKDDVGKFIDWEKFGMNEVQFLEYAKIALNNLIEQNIIMVDDDSTHEYGFFYKLNPDIANVVFVI